MKGTGRKVEKVTFKQKPKGGKGPNIWWDLPIFMVGGNVTTKVLVGKMCTW